MAPLIELNHWIWYLRFEEHEAAKTLEKYAYTICDYYRYCEAIGIKALEAIPADLQHYCDDMFSTRQVVPNTINNAARVLENFYRFLLGRSYVVSLPFTSVVKRYSYGMLNGTTSAERGISDLRRRKNQSQRKFLHREELSEFVKSLPSFRNKVIALLMWATGLRISEVLSLTIKPPHLPIDRAKYISAERSFDCEIVGKGNKTRIVEIPSDLLQEIDRYIESHRPKTGSDVLFLDDRNVRGEGLTTGAIQAAFRRHTITVGIHVKPHILRHGFAIERLIFWEAVFAQRDRSAHEPSHRATKPIRVDWNTPRYLALKQVSIELGHSSVTTTEIYLKYLDSYKAKIHGMHKDWTRQLMAEYG